jgi:predicted nucleotidyltransferase
VTHPVLVRRRAEQERLLGVARTWATVAGPLLDAHCVVVVGSVARGDFNRWSDIDVLVVAENLPDTLAARLARLTTSNRPPGVEAILWTPDELAERWSRGNDPMAREAYRVGVVVYGELPDRGPQAIHDERSRSSQIPSARVSSSR